MTTPDGTDIFYGSIPVFRGFGRLMDPAMYAPLPDDWTVGVEHGRRRRDRGRHQCAR